MEELDTGYLVTTDLHLTDKKEDEYKWSIFKSITDYVTINHVKTLVLCGDLCDKKDRHTSKLVNRICDELEKLLEICPWLEIHILKGNHDYLDSDFPFFRFLKLHPNIRYICSVTVINNIAYIPHIDFNRDDKNLHSIETLNTTSINVCFMHQTVVDTPVYGGSSVIEAEPTLKDFVKQFDTVFCGDIHVPQQIGNVVYIGAPTAHKYGDEYQGRMLSITDNTWEEILLNNVRKWNITFEGDPEVFKELDKVDVARGDMVKVNLVFTDHEISEYSFYKTLLIKELETRGIIKYKINSTVSSTSGDVRPKVELKIDTPEQVLEKYCEHRELEGDLIEVGKEIIDGV